MKGGPFWHRFIKITTVISTQSRKFFIFSYICRISMYPKMKPKRVLILFLLTSFLCLSKLHGQYVSYGADPWGQRWQQITTPHFKLIYPKTIDSLAQRYAWLLDTSYTIGSRSIGHKPIQIPVILHPDNVFSNGVVVWAPRRMEIYTTPPTQSYAQDWSKQLALHEFRHVAQIDKMNTGVMRVAYYLFGEQASALWLLPVPKWFLEGDAVATETALSSSGRGRSSEFHMAYRAYLMSGVEWSYDRWVNGSYKYNVPNVYNFGYQNVAYARYKYGVDIWDKVLSQSAHGYFNIPAFSNAFKKYTGINTKQLQKEAFDYLKQQWIEEEKVLEVDKNTSYLPSRNGDYVSLRSPIAIDEQTMVVVEVSNDKPSRLLFGDKKITFNYNGFNGDIAQYRGKLYWSESVSDPRWQQRSYANIKSLDTKSGVIKKHTRKGRYFTVAFNDSLDYYATSGISREGTNTIHILDAANDKEIKQFNVPAGNQVSDLQWLNTDGTLAVLVLNNKGMGIYSFNLNNEEWNVLLPESYTNISGIAIYNDYILFESEYSGINNIYALNPTTKKIYKVTSSRLGAFDAATFGDTLYFSDYQKNGHRLAQKELNKTEWEEVNWSHPYRFSLAETLSIQENFNIDTVAIPTDIQHESKPYRKPLHLIHVHSWMPFYTELDSELNFDPDELIQSIKPGFTLLSQNLLSTAVTRLGYSYENGYNAGHASFTYSGWYPVIDITANYGGGKQRLITEGQLSKGTENLYDVGAAIYVPLVFNGTRSLSGFIPQVNIKHTNDSYYVPSEDDYQSATRLDLFLQHYTYSRSATRDINPRWGYRILLARRSMPFDTENFGTMYGARLTVYTPGLFANHSLKLSGSLQRQDVKRYYMSNLMSFPRGYDSFPSKELQFFSADYAFPIAYPDFNIGSLLYFKRFRLNLFTDVGQNSYYRQNGIVTTNLFSYGIDIIADYHVARKEYPFMTGLRLVKPRNNGLSAELLFNVSF